MNQSLDEESLSFRNSLKLKMQCWREVWTLLLVMNNKILLKTFKETIWIRFSQIWSWFEYTIRIRLDKTLSSWGDYSFNICIQRRHGILNVRTTGDSISQLLCFSINGSKVIVFENLLSNISYFLKCITYLVPSDHCQISILLEIHCNIKVDIS